LADLVRTGLAGVDARPPSFWSEQAKRLVDAQAPGLASAVDRLASIPGAGRDWPARLLGECGRLKLLIEAYGRLDALDPPLAHEVRQLIGWTVSESELHANGEVVSDRWVVIGQSFDDEDRVRVERSWLVGRQTARVALVLQFSAAGQPFPEAILPGTEQSGSLVFYPGVSRLRARLQAREGLATEVTERPPGHDAVEELLEQFAQTHKRLPWLNLLGSVVRDAVLVPGDDQWHLVDAHDQALPVIGADHWRLLSVSGGRPADLAGQWDGRGWRPLGMFCNGQFWVA
jgi:hypothetical protein